MILPPIKHQNNPHTKPAALCNALTYTQYSQINSKHTRSEVRRAAGLHLVVLVGGGVVVLVVPLLQALVGAAGGGGGAGLVDQRRSENKEEKLEDPSCQFSK